MKQVIFPLRLDHFEPWQRLFRSYADFYHFTVTEKSVATTWHWLMDEDHPVQGLVAYHEEQLAGFAHFRAMPSPLRGEYVGFLDDLFVEPDQRGNDLASKLIAGVEQEAVKNGWGILRWITRDNNYRARNLYDKLAQKTDWNLYEMKPLNRSAGI